MDMPLRLKNKKLYFIVFLILLIVFLILFYWFSNKDTLIISNNSSNTITYVKIHINDSNLNISDTIIIENINPYETKKIKMNSPLLKKGSGSWGYQYKVLNEPEIAIRFFSSEHHFLYSNKIELQFNDSEILALEGLIFQQGKPNILNFIK